MDRALEAVEGVGGAVHAHLKRLVVIVSAGFAYGHGGSSLGCDDASTRKRGPSFRACPGWTLCRQTVVMIHDTPYLLPDTRQFLLKAAHPNASSVPRSEALPVAIDEAVARAEGVQVIDFTDDICGPQMCSLMRAGRIIYSDNHHLTSSFWPHASRTFQVRTCALTLARFQCLRSRES
jgi:SGNH domain (fused to AT3 domains)